MAKQWTIEEDQYLRENYPYKRIQEVCEHLGFNRQRVHDRAIRIGVKKIKFYTTPSAKSKETQFKPGKSSWNKGMFGIRLSPATEFKKGCEPHNKLPDELREVSLLRRKLTKNIKERIKRYDQKQNTRLTQSSI
jgi:hypothetical protein